MAKLIVTVIFLFACGAMVSPPASANLLMLQVGMEGPQFSLATLDGKTKKSTELQGDKLTVLVFWSSWIKKSEAVLARMQKLYAHFGLNGFSVVGINVDEQKPSHQTLNKVRETRDKLKIEFPMLVDPGMQTFRDYGVIALPTTVILDKDRIIRHGLSGYPLVGAESMEDFITAAMTGDKQRLAAASPGYQPSKSAISFYNMGVTTLKSKALSAKAEQWFKKAAEADPGFVLPHLSLGRIYSGRGDVALAQAEYRAVLAKEPQHTVALCELAILLVIQGKSGEGLKLLDTARKSEESYAPCYYYTGYALGREGKTVDADRMFEEAKKLNPSDYQVYVYQGMLSEQNKDLKGAAESYGQALEKIIHAY
jgi:alkyl hydroperoxide reductase subunit AhpC/Flp pilus assembly protein TadD